MNRGIQFSLSDNLYIKDPQETKFGKRILFYTVELMSEIGFENFTFKKLAEKMQSAEASIYRYFENKHKLLVFLSCWYWEWVHYLIDINILNIEDPKRKIEIMIYQLLHASKQSNQTEYINENLLHKLIIVEGVKAIHHQDVDDERKMGNFKSRINLIEKMTAIILELQPKFGYPETLAASIVDITENQLYYKDHLPTLSSIKSGPDPLEQLEKIILHFTFVTLGKI